MDTTQKKLVASITVNIPSILLYCIQTKEKKSIYPGSYISFRVGDGSRKITAMCLQVAEKNKFVIALHDVDEKFTRYIGRVEYTDMRLALPEIIIRKDAEGLYKSEF